MNCIIYDSARTETLESTAMTNRTLPRTNREKQRSSANEIMSACANRERERKVIGKCAGRFPIRIWMCVEHPRNTVGRLRRSHLTLHINRIMRIEWAKPNQNIVFWWKEHFFLLSFEIIDGVCPKFRILSNMFCDGVAHLSFVDSVFGFLLSWICVVNWMGRPDKIHTKFVLNFGFGGDKRKKKNQKKNEIRFLCLMNRNRLGAN